MSLLPKPILIQRTDFLRRSFRDLLKDPELLRRYLRESQPAQILLCVLMGSAIGAVTAALHELVTLGHQLSFGLRPHERLSEATDLRDVAILYVPALGGLLLGLSLLLMKWWRPGDIVDPIEANAIYGGRMSVIDSGRLLFAALLSNAAGASVGMEAAYTQVGGGLASWFGQRLQLRRDDMRIFVAAGAGAAIAAAFNAPLAGAFYGFELVLGTYTIAALPQVALCALTATLMLRLLTQSEPLFTLPLAITDIPLWDYPVFIAMGIVAAEIGIATMKLAARSEQLSRKMSLPDWARPVIGGLAVSAVAFFFPQVLGSGQGAINNHLNVQWGFVALLGLVAAKIVASSLSIGFGFRGGLFSSSLLIGCVFGQLAGAVADWVLPQSAGQLESFMLVGMGAVAASIVGAPVTMVLLVLEMTGNFPATTGVMIGVLVSSTVTRYSFGYSFSTWRFHLRGLRIAGAYDVGWINDVTVQTLMQAEVTTVPASLPLPELRTMIPPGSVKRVYVVDLGGQYKGIIEVAQIHDRDLDNTAATLCALDLAKGQDFFLLPGQNIRDALDLFTKWESEELPVVASERDAQIIGMLSEPYTLKRYAQELEARNLAQSGARAPVTKS
jgi:CIC family chloride channel protein